MINKKINLIYIFKIFRILVLLCLPLVPAFDLPAKFLAYILGVNIVIEITIAYFIKKEKLTETNSDNKNENFKHQK